MTLAVQGENPTMTDLTALEVQVLAALTSNRPMTSDELSRAVSDAGLHLSSETVAASLQALAGNGLAERTPTASLGKYRVTPQGRSWLAGYTATGNLG
jgi:predicted transcriptional regulator